MFNLEIFKDKQALIAERDSLATQVKELEPLKQKLAEYEKLVSELPTVKQQFDADLEKIKHEHKAEVEKLTAQLTEKTTVVAAVPDLVKSQVEQKLSNIGIQEGTLPVTVETEKPVDMTFTGTAEEFQSFFKANKEKIFAAMRNK